MMLWPTAIQLTGYLHHVRGLYCWRRLQPEPSSEFHIKVLYERYRELVQGEHHLLQLLEVQRYPFAQLPRASGLKELQADGAGRKDLRERAR